MFFASLTPFSTFQRGFFLGVACPAKSARGGRSGVGLLMTMLTGFFGILSPLKASAAPSTITFRYQHHLFTLAPKDFPDWRVEKERWLSGGSAIVPPAELRVDGDSVPSLPTGIVRTKEVIWNRAAITADIEELVTVHLERSPGSVTIGKDAAGKIIFTGVGLPGREIDHSVLTDLTIQALSSDITEIEIPLVNIQPAITVADPDLAAQGIREVVTVGESDFSNSPAARRHNIATGMAKFNGHLIPKGKVFSFVETLGPVNAATGYWKELVIKGARTEPDFGGGLCQVSSTAYRGVWEYGFPITDRRNHSFAVNHYAPQGTDATVYPGSADMKFLNDSPGSLLMQTHTEGDLAYFIYYGTKDSRKSQIYGPFIWDKRGPPADRTEMTTEIPPGTTKKVGERVSGMKAAWFRVTQRPDTAEKTEPVYSTYEARPRYTLVGIAAAAPVEGAEGSGSSSAPVPGRESSAPASGNSTSANPRLRF